MQRPDEKKRQLIVATAARMFGTRPFHKVRLDDIAAEAKIGKGTLYVYFDNKEDLYISLIYDGFERLVEDLRRELLATDHNGVKLPAMQSLRRAVEALVGFAFAHPHLFEMMRNVGEIKRLHAAEWKAKRREFMDLISETIRRGIKAGEVIDHNPELTAACLGGMVRSIMLFGPRNLTAAEVAEHVYRLVSRGIAADTGHR